MVCFLFLQEIRRDLQSRSQIEFGCFLNYQSPQRRTGTLASTLLCATLWAENKIFSGLILIFLNGDITLNRASCIALYGHTRYNSGQCIFRLSISLSNLHTFFPTEFDKKCTHSDICRMYVWAHHLLFKYL